jgi:hypothetical protein
MVSRDFPQIELKQPTHSLLELLIELFTLGIFSVEGGAKAWFELILVTAVLCLSGYFLWWQIPLLIATIILATFAAGMFSVLAPQYLDTGNFRANEKIAATLQVISDYNLNEIPTLSGNRREKRLEQLYKAQKIFERNPKIVEQISELRSIFNNINQVCDIAEEQEKQRKESEEKKQQEEADRKRRESEARQERRKREAELKAQQEKVRQAAKEKEEQEASQQEKIWKTWLYEQRRMENFTGGCPPDNSYEPPRCRPGYPIKVTLNKKEDGFDGIIWQPSDTGYEKVKPRWCYKSVQEALAERGKYRFRRPKNR